MTHYPVDESELRKFIVVRIAFPLFWVASVWVAVAGGWNAYALPRWSVAIVVAMLWALVEKKYMEWRDWSVSVDEQGIWPTHLGKEKALVKWSSVAGLQMNDFKGSMDLFDGDGKRLIRLSYELRSFADLREYVNREFISRLQDRDLPISSRRSPVAGVVLLGSLFLLWLLTSFLADFDYRLWGFVLWVLMIVVWIGGFYESMIGVDFHADRLVLKWLFSQKRVPYDTIVSVHRTRWEPPPADWEVWVHENSSLRYQVKVETEEETYALHALGVGHMEVEMLLGELRTRAESKSANG